MGKSLSLQMGDPLRFLTCHLKSSQIEIDILCSDLVLFVSCCFFIGVCLLICLDTIPAVM